MTAHPRSALDDLAFEAGDASLRVSRADGGRIRSLEIASRELLVTSSTDGPIRWGCYPMAPWAGRIRDGRFAFRGHVYEMPRNMPPHAVHGTAFDRPWRVLDERTLGLELAAPWPFRGRLVERFELGPTSLTVTLELDADEPMPATLGWHPWFRRRLSPGGQEAALGFAPREMLRRDATGMPSGERVAPTPGPWDDAFTGVDEPPVLEWPGELRLEISSSCPWWVVYTEPANALCVEPQSGPPDALNLAPEVVEPGSPLVHTMTWRWTQPG